MTTQEIGGSNLYPPHVELVRIIFENLGRDSEEAVEDCQTKGAKYVTKDLVVKIKYYLGRCEQLLREAETAANE